MKNLLIAKIAHLICTAYCLAAGIEAPTPWDELSDDAKDARAGDVEYLKTNQSAGPDALHVQWKTVKEAEGWTFGETRDEEAKTHPGLVPFLELPLETQIRDSLFAATVSSLEGQPDGEALQAKVVELKGLLDDANAAKASGEKGANSTGSTSTTGVPEGFTPITYIGKRDSYFDGAYSQLTFSKGETQLVPTGKAAAMLKHVDQYIVGDIGAVPEASKKSPASTAKPTGNSTTDADSEESIQQAKDNVNAMTDADSIRKYVSTNFADHKLHPKLGLEKAKIEAIRLIDQFGLK